MRLLALIRSWGTDVPYLSRIRIEPRPNVCMVVGSIARLDSQEALGLREDASTIGPYRPGPVATDDVAGRARNNPPVVMLTYARAADREGRVEAAALPDQVEELCESGLVGGLNVERLASGAWIVSTHAATKAERTAWVLSLHKR